MTMTNGNTTLQETAAKGVEAIHTIVKERDQLIINTTRMETDIALLRQKVGQLETRLETATVERDHYMRFSTELVTKINAMQMVFEDAIRSAKHSAYKPPQVPPPNKPEALLDTKSLEKLIRRLPVNGGGNESSP